MSKGKQGIVVLSLFDGISCGHLALDQIGIKVKKYFASEVEVNPIKVTNYNYPDTVQLGDVVFLRKMLTWKASIIEKFFASPYISDKRKKEGRYLYELKEEILKADLCIFGSPCQGFSFSGLGLNFNDPRSRLFFEADIILNAVKKKNPDVVFLMENVRMLQEHEMVISKYMGVEPIKINSALVSAQNRQRLYWCNINIDHCNLFGDVRSTIPQPRDKGILLKHILQPSSEVDKKYYLSKTAIDRIIRHSYSNPQLDPEKTGTINTKNNSGQLSLDSGTTLITDNAQGRFPEIKYQAQKSPPLRSHLGASHDNKVVEKINVFGKPKANQDKASTFTAGAHSAGEHKEMDLLLIHEPKQAEEITTGVIDSRGAGGFRETGDKSQCVDANYHKGPSAGAHGQRTVVREVKQINPAKQSNLGSTGQPFQQNRIYSTDGIAPALASELGGERTHLILEPSETGDNGADPVMLDMSHANEGVRSYTGKSSAIMGKDYKEPKLILTEPYHTHGDDRTYEEKAPTMTSRYGTGGDNIPYVNNIRRLTPLEVARLQTIPDSYFYDKNGKQLVSDSAIYKAVGNSFTVLVIAYILSYSPFPKDEKKVKKLFFS